MRRLLAALIALLSVAGAPRPAAAADTVLRIATLAPDGSSWMKRMRQWQHAVEARTGGRVRIKFYAGGVQGDERDVLRKIKLGTLSGGAVTGIGLSAIDPQVRVLDATQTYADLDKVRAALGDFLKQQLEDKGFVLLAWGDVGPVHFFSNRPVKSLADIQATRPWLWSDDPVSRKLFAALDLHGVPMGVPDVLPALSTGTVDAFFGSPLAALALQWNTHARYMTSMTMMQATGATVLARSALDSVSPEDRAALLDEARKMEADTLAQVRAENAQALDAVVKRGVVVVPTPPEMQEELRRRTEPVALEMGKGFSPELQSKLKQLIEASKRQ
jgi:TRAP-type C4-dicarboxylate transport system substrate-binding protein